MSQYLFLLLILACPLMMIFMMRGMHGGQGGNAEGGHTHGMAGSSSHGNMHGQGDSASSLDDLRRQREYLDRQIEEREAEEQTPVGSGWR